VVAVAGGSTSQGVPDIVQQARNGAASSMWRPVAHSDGSWAFQNQNSGLCLDVYGAGSNAGQQLDQWPCKNAAGSTRSSPRGEPAADETAAVGNAGRSGRRATRRRPAFRPTVLG
jgi:hypothetical protein